MWFRLRYSRSESPQTTKTLTLLEIPGSTAHFWGGTREEAYREFCVHGPISVSVGRGAPLRLRLLVLLQLRLAAGRVSSRHIAGTCHSSCIGAFVSSSFICYCKSACGCDCAMLLNCPKKFVVNVALEINKKKQRQGALTPETTNKTRTPFGFKKQRQQKGENGTTNEKRVAIR